VADDGGRAPVDQPGGKVFGDARVHVGSCWMSRHSRANVTAPRQVRQSVTAAIGLSTSNRSATRVSRGGQVPLHPCAARP
jgi:hypothetical protein